MVAAPLALELELAWSSSGALLECFAALAASQKSRRGSCLPHGDPKASPFNRSVNGNQLRVLRNICASSFFSQVLKLFHFCTGSQAFLLCSAALRDLSLGWSGVGGWGCTAQDVAQKVKEHLSPQLDQEQVKAREPTGLSSETSDMATTKEKEERIWAEFPSKWLQDLRSC